MGDEIVVGVDLGTTNSVIAHVNASGQPEVLPNAEGGRITPSVVQIRRDGTMIVGETAKREVILEKEHTAQFFKRDMGTPTVYEYHGRPYSPVDLSAVVLEALKRDAETALGAEIQRAIITVPAYFQDGARVATQAAGENAGLEVVQIINEPTAAAVAYGLKEPRQDEVVMVYDLGGGTFDITLVRVGPNGIEVIGTDGNHNLGGKDWDDRLAQHVSAEFRRRHGVDPLEDPYTYQEILLRVEDAKKSLSARSTVMVPVNCQGKMDRIEVSRQQFESLTRDLLVQTETLMLKVFEETHSRASDLSNILMVGGSTRMHMCVDLVRRITGRSPSASVNPDECVALGAAIQASLYGSESRRPRLLALRGATAIRDVMSHSMGMIALSADGDRYLNSILIPKNRPIPCHEVRPYQVQALEGRETTVSVVVTQGESEDPANCSFVGKYVIRGITPNKGPAVVDIAYTYDRSGVVSVSATERSTGRGLSVVKEPVPDDMSWVFQPPPRTRVRHKTVYVAVDLSGSMSGKPLSDAQAAVHTFIERSDLSHTSIGLISFADGVQVDQPATQDGRRLSRAVAAWSIGGDLGYGNDADPFNVTLEQVRRGDSAKYLVVLTDGVWSYQAEAKKRAKACHEAGIEVIAIGFGGADRRFLQAIATSDEAALYSESGGLASAFGDIAQVLLESDGGSVGASLSLLRRR